MNRRELLGAAATAAGAALLGAPVLAQEKTIRVLCWSEHTEPASVYPNGGNAVIAEYLNTLPGIKATTAYLQDADQGVSDSTLENIDVITWWGHQKHNDVRDDRVAAILKRVNENGLGVLALHSSHYSKLLKRGLNTSGDLGGVGDTGLAEHVYVLNAKHPIAKDVQPFTVPHEEFYDEPFGIPPGEIVFFSVFDYKRENGFNRVFRSGVAYNVGKGRLFYFRPGHEAYPTYHQPEVQHVIGNAVRWLAQTT